MNDSGELVGVDVETPSYTSHASPLTEFSPFMKNAPEENDNVDRHDDTAQVIDSALHRPTEGLGPESTSTLETPRHLLGATDHMMRAMGLSDLLLSSTQETANQQTLETPSHQFSDTTEHMMGRMSISDSSRPWEGRQRLFYSALRLRLCKMKRILGRHAGKYLFFFLGMTMSAALLARRRQLTNSHHDPPPMPAVIPSYKPTQSPSLVPEDERLAKVLACASWLSGCPISQHDDPVRWKVVEYFHQGSGMHIDTNDCKEEKSLFSTMYSLIAIRESLYVANPSWNEQRSYVTDLWTVCRWKRVECGRMEGSETPTVTALMLNSADLSGTVPSEIKGLWGLEYLNLVSNSGLVGSLPSELGMLRNLQHITVHYSNLSGTVPNTIGKLLKLEEFRLYGTKLIGTMPAEICSLRSKGSLSVLAADCSFVECACCTDCKHYSG